MDNDINHPYYPLYNWYVERIVNGADDRAKSALKKLCGDIRAYDMLHAECVGIVERYDNEQC